MYFDRIKNYFDIRKNFVKYGAYHRNETNKWIHIVCVPIIFSASLPLVSWLKLFTLGSGYVVTAADAVTAFYVSSFFAMDAPAALLYMPVVGLMWWAGTTIFASNPLLLVTAQVVCWAAQFIGHGLIEKRRPALMDNLPESLHAAVFFVWLELLFMFGYKKDLHRELTVLVEAEAAKLAVMDKASELAQKMR